MKKLTTYGIWFIALLTLTGTWACNTTSTATDPPADPPSLVGAWELIESSGQKTAETPGLRVFAIATSDYAMSSYFNAETSQFLGSNGGPYTLSDGKITQTIHYHTGDTSLVGSQFTLNAAFDGDLVTLSGEVRGNTINDTWKRVDDGDAPLAGDWRIRDRMMEGEMVTLKMSPGRQTVKILSGTRFQWTAMNTETKEFRGCGGGSYTFENGVYTENIEFFSRDSTRVGASLAFEGSVEGDDWTHSGKSSKGNPIKEVWVR